MRKQPKQFAAYRVAYSDNPNVPVGTVLVDRRWDLHRHWTTIDLNADGKFSEFGGPRLVRICATCRLQHRRVTLHGHDGPCTPDTPRWKPTDDGGAS